MTKQLLTERKSGNRIAAVKLLLVAVAIMGTVLSAKATDCMVARNGCLLLQPDLKNSSFVGC